MFVCLALIDILVAVNSTEANLMTSYLPDIFRSAAFGLKRTVVFGGSIESSLLDPVDNKRRSH